MSADIQRIREVANRARHHACTSAHKRGNREVVIIDRDDLDVLAAYTEAFADGVERARSRRAAGGEARCVDG